MKSRPKNKSEKVVFVGAYIPEQLSIILKLKMQSIKRPASWGIIKALEAYLEG